MTEDEKDPKDSNDKLSGKPGAKDSDAAHKGPLPSKEDDSPLGSTDQHSGA